MNKLVEIRSREFVLRRARALDSDHGIFWLAKSKSGNSVLR